MGKKLNVGEPGGAHSMSGAKVSIEEATRRQLELNRIARETQPLEQQRHQKLQDDLAKIREKKRRRRERKPYDFS